MCAPGMSHNLIIDQLYYFCLWIQLWLWAAVHEDVNGTYGIYD